MNPVLLVINYLFRASFIVIGIYFLIATGRIPLSDPGIVRIMGVIFILFGLYRVATFYSSQRRTRRDD